MSIWSALGLGFLDFGFNVAQQKIQNDFNAKEAEKQRDFNSAEAEKQRDWSTSEREATQSWNLQQWHRENEYNSPQAQMQRMLDAGINPNSAINQLSNVAGGSVRSSAGSGAAASGAAASSVGMINSNFQGIIGNYLQNQVLKAQVDNIKAQTQGLKETNSWIGPKMMSEVFKNKADETYVKEMTNNVKLLNEKYGLDIDYQKGFNDFSKEQWNFQKNCFQIEMARLVQEYINSVNQGVNIEKEGVLLDEKVQTENAQQGLIGQQTEGQNKENKLKDIAISVGEVKAMFLKDFGIMCDDNTAGVFAKCLQLRAEGKDDQADKLQEKYFSTFEQFATRVEGRTWEHAVGKVLQVPAEEGSAFIRRFNEWANSYNKYYPFPF